MVPVTTESQLVARWKTPHGDKVAQETLHRLRAGESLKGLEHREHAGRVDLRGLPLRVPEPIKRNTPNGWTVEELPRLTKFERVRLADLDLTGAELQSLRFFETTIANCRFDDSNCRDWRLWATRVTDTTFAGADLREAALGPWLEGRGNVYERVTFSGAN